MLTQIQLQKEALAMDFNIMIGEAVAIPVVAIVVHFVWK